MTILWRSAAAHPARLHFGASTHPPVLVELPAAVREQPEPATA